MIFHKDWDKLQLCDCVKILLRTSGYDCELCFENVNEDLLLELENHIEKQLLNLVAELKCSHSKAYSKSEGIFRFLPGHRAMILNLKQQFALMRKSISSNLEKPPTNIQSMIDILDEVKNATGFSELLKQLIESAVNNYSKTPNLYRYSEFIRFVAIYLFLQFAVSIHLNNL